MKKQIPLLFLAFLFYSSSFAQNMGFRTTDIGGEYQWYPRGSVYNLHVAFNAKLNHSIQLRLGYNHVPAYRTDAHTEYGKGWGGGLGYRYYFKPFPYKFFVGARADLWVMKLNLDYDPAGGPAVFLNNTVIVQPALETGYTFVINDIVFFTPYISAGLQTDFDQMTKDIKYGKGFVPVAGICAGFRF